MKGNVARMARLMHFSEYAVNFEETGMIAQRVTIFVTPGFSQWSVREKDCEKPIAYFTSKDEAVKYATAFARTKSSALLHVLDERGDVITEQRYDMNPDGPVQPPIGERPDARSVRKR